MAVYVSEGEDCRGAVVKTALQKKEEAKQREVEAILAKVP